MMLTTVLLMAAGMQAADTGGVKLRMDALVMGVDSFTLLVQGRTFGSQVFSVSRDGDTIVLTEETVTPAGGQKTRVELDAQGRMRSVRQTGSSRGAPMNIELDYADGRVRGTSLTPPATTSTAVDTAVPAHVMDDNALFKLLPAFPWGQDSVWTFAMFSGGTNSLEERTLRVTGSETVAVPAGTFDTYRAEMASDATTVHFFVTKAAPHRVVKIAIAGSPLEFVLESSRDR
jgi:hypothetical protein